MNNPNDQIRRIIMRYFYDRNARASSRFGKSGSAVKISDVKRDLKTRPGLTQQQVVSNLTYLIDRGWVKTVDIEKTVRVPGGSVPSTVTWYEITAQGIDRIEGDSEFRVHERYAGINVTALGSNIITLGDGNVVNARFADLHRQLDTLKRAVAQSTQLEESEKLGIAVNIESLKDQLASPSPERGVVGKLWSVIERAATAAGLAQHVARVVPLITRLLPG